MYKVILDTDIGDDIDDAIALALAVNREEINLMGVVTTYRNTYMRAKIALALLDGWSRLDIPVCQGFDDPLKQAYFYFPFEKRDENGNVLTTDGKAQYEICSLHRNAFHLLYLLHPLRYDPDTPLCYGRPELCGGLGSDGQRDHLVQ